MCKTSIAPSLRLTLGCQGKLTDFSICMPRSPCLSLQMIHSFINARLWREAVSCLAQPGRALSSIIRPLYRLPSFSTVLPSATLLNSIRTNSSAASAQSSVVSLAPALRWLMTSQEHLYRGAELVASCRPRHITAKLLGNAIFHRLCPTALQIEATAFHHACLRCPA